MGRSKKTKTHKAKAKTKEVLPVLPKRSPSSANQEDPAQSQDSRKTHQDTLGNIPDSLDLEDPAHSPDTVTSLEGKEIHRDSMVKHRDLGAKPKLAKKEVMFSPCDSDNTLSKGGQNVQSPYCESHPYRQGDSFEIQTNFPKDSKI